jgi:hypothetical protein
MTITASYLGRRLATTWPVFIFVALFGWLDWFTHRDRLFLIVTGVVAAGLLILGPAIISALKVTDVVAKIPWWVKPFLWAAPAYAYMFIRGQGTRNAGVPIIVTGLVLLAALLLAGPVIDVVLSGYYRVRNRLVPRTVRILLSPVLAIVLSFLIVHGDLSSIPALWGGHTNLGKPASITSTTLFVVAALLSMIVTTLLLRDVSTRHHNVDEVSTGGSS